MRSLTAGPEKVRPAGVKPRTATRFLLATGIFAALWYAGMNVFVPLLDANYSSASQTVSELSAIGAPTRTAWFWLGIAYALLITLFGLGVWNSERGRLGRFLGVLFIAQGLICFVWPPMNLREVIAVHGRAPTDTMHIAVTMVWGVLAMTSMVCGAVKFPGAFRIFSIVALAVVLAFGILTGMDSPKMEANHPTPYIGVWERINIAAYLVWMVALSMRLIDKSKEATDGVT